MNSKTESSKTLNFVAISSLSITELNLDGISERYKPALSIILGNFRSEERRVGKECER